MISIYKKRKLAFITVVYWVLLLFIVAAWIWWFISLEKQNNQMLLYKLLQLNKDEPGYLEKLNRFQKEHALKTAQFISEGISFVLVTLIGAVFVYRATRKQILLSNQQQNFMMAITHELKTPIAVMNLNLETLQKRKLDEKQQEKIINATLQEADRLNILTTNILVTSQLESGSYTSQKENINLSLLVEDAVNDFSSRFTNRKFEQNIQPQIYINGEKVLLSLLLNNLLDNAIKYSAKEKLISVQLTKQNSLIQLQVADEGIGIAEEEKKNIFNKFYRSGNEATRKTKGTGLGLYLCKRIANSHKAKIKVLDNNAAGSIFLVEFKA